MSNYIFTKQYTDLQVNRIKEIEAVFDEWGVKDHNLMYKIKEILRDSIIDHQHYWKKYGFGDNS